MQTRPTSLQRPTLTLGVCLALSLLIPVLRLHAQYSGEFLSVAGATPLPPGQDLTFTMTVQNSGIITWYSADTPTWINRVYAKDCSWHPTSFTVLTALHWGSVQSGETVIATDKLSAAQLPSSPGTYTFFVSTYCLTDTPGEYSLMSGSPKKVTFTISTLVPEIDVQGNSISIENGDMTPDLNDHTDFGAVPELNKTVVRTYSILNKGNKALNLSGNPKVTISGLYASEFTVSAQPGTPIPAGGSTTFQVSFDPLWTGVREATLSIASDDNDENPYEFKIQGTGTQNTYVITFDPQGGTAPNPPSIIVTNDFYYGPLPTTSRTGYVLRGWWPNSYGNGSKVTSATWVSLNGPQTLYAIWAANISVTIKTSRSGLAFSVDGTTYTNSQNFTWAWGSSHTVATTSPQPGEPGVQYVFGNWSTTKGSMGSTSAMSHMITCYADAIYSAGFSTQYYVTVNAGPGGTVSSNSGWHHPGIGVKITAFPNSGYIFNNWIGTGTGSFTGTDNPVTLTPGGNVTETANFIPPPKMSALVSGTNLIISWPANVSSFKLKTTNVLAEASLWQTVTSNPRVVGTNYQMTIPTRGGAGFFRLEK